MMGLRISAHYLVSLLLMGKIASKLVTLVLLLVGLVSIVIFIYFIYVSIILLLLE